MPRPMAWIGWRWGLGGCALALACSGNGGDDGATSVADSTDDESADDDDDATDPSADDDDGPTDPSADDDDDDDDTSVDDSITDTDASATSEGTDDAAESTTGEDTLCGIQEEVGDAPWFELSHYGEAVAGGSVLALECGGQGSWMFFISVELGGWTPTEEHVYLSVTMDVPGHEGPTGHFFQTPMYPLYVGCEEFDGGGAPVGLAIIPPDDITDVTVLDGLYATLHVELLADGSPTVDAEVLLAVPDELDPKACMPFG
jgi:hypothetical protein